MANQQHLDILRQRTGFLHGPEAWNKWREEHPEIQPDLSGADLSDLNLSGANLSYADCSGTEFSSTDMSEANLIGAVLSEAELVVVDLSRANLSNAILYNAELSGSNFSEADLSGASLSGAIFNGPHINGFTTKNANLSGVNLSGANLSEVDLSGINFSGANLSNANLRRANLQGSNLSEANLSGADLTESYVYAISAWNVHLENTPQTNLIITRDDEPTITVDNLEVAQFIYLLLNNKKTRDVIDTITSKVVLILGRFTPERKAVLDALRDELRERNYSPVLFDFEKPASRDITETVSTLAHLARFVIADITDAKSIPQELKTVIPNLPSVPILPLILDSQHEYGMFEHFTRFPWALPVYRYTDEVSLLQSLEEKVIAPAEQKAKELAQQ